ncbi:MAG: preprotein translocase subunit SecG [Bacteroidota bacterium]
MYITVTVFIIIASILLALVVLVQNSKGGGLASGFSASNQVMGVRKTTDFLEKFTWGLATTVIVLCILGAFALPKKSSTEGASVIQEQIDNATVPNQQAPQIPGGGQQQPGQQQAPPPAPAK